MCTLFSSRLFSMIARIIVRYNKAIIKCDKFITDIKRTRYLNRLTFRMIHKVEKMDIPSTCTVEQ